MTRLLNVQVGRDEDVVLARQRARQVAAALGFDAQDQTRIATAVSELARNVARYAGSGSVEFALDIEDPALAVTIADQGPGIPHLDSELDGTYRSQTGMGVGITGARRIMDEFSISSSPGRGTVAQMRKRIPRRRQLPGRQDVARIADELTRQAPRSMVDEVQEQNHELLAALAELRQRQEDLARLNAELQDTNRGVVALYAELDEKAEHLRRADEMKSKFLSNMTHEFQTPLNSILALTRLLLDRADGDLSVEQEKQVTYIRQATEDLSELVHDLLDLAKVEAGKVTLRPTSFAVQELFGALRGLMRPVQTNEAVALLFDSADRLPPLYTDEGKVSQILRNYISNALKFTERGEVTVAAALNGDGTVTFSVSDTGIGIAAADQERLFHEFGQVPNRLQAKVRGTGLGLSLSKRLAELLGGSVGVRSVTGEGSTFLLTIPMTAPGHKAPAATAAPPSAAVNGTLPPLALVIDDEQTARYLLRRSLIAVGCRVVEAEGGTSGLARAESEQPDVIFLDLRMPDMLGAEVLARLKRNPATAAIPVIISTSQIVADEERQRLTAHAAALLGKAQLAEPQADDEVRRALRSANVNV
jgi:signal transduction histidine kinase/ActR/RegA family two-component response regulator